MVAALVRRCSVTSETVYSLRPGASARGSRIWSAECGIDRAAGGVLEGEQLGSTASSATTSAGLPRSPSPTNVAGTAPSCSAIRRSRPPATGPTSRPDRSRRPSPRSARRASRRGRASARRCPAGGGRLRRLPGSGPGGRGGPRDGVRLARARSRRRAGRPPGDRSPPRASPARPAARAPSRWRAPGRLQERERRGLRVERAAGQRDPDRPLGAERQGEVQGLEHQAGRAGGADVDLEVAGRVARRAEGQVARPDRPADDLGAAQQRRRPRRAVRCCGRRPGFSRLARILTIRNGRPVKSASVRAVRRICPPPSRASRRA